MNMFDKIKKVAAENKDLAAWIVTGYRTEATELFYVLDKLETTRAKDVIEYQLTVYVDKDGKRGNATVSVYEYMDEEELKGVIKDALYNAEFALMPMFELTKPSDKPLMESESNLKGADFKKVAEDVAGAVFAANTFEDGYLAATEIFINKKTTTVVNSEGVNLSGVSYDGYIELIPSWNKEDKEFETYHAIKFESLDLAAITEETRKELEYSRDRANAVALDKAGLPEGLNVIIAEEEVAQLFNYMTMDLEYSMEYQKSNMFKIGDCVNGPDPKGTLLNLTKCGYYKGCTNSRAFDVSGNVLTSKELVRDGKVVSKWGSNRFGQYLGIKEPTGGLPVTLVKEGDTSIEEMEKKPYLLCVKFSDMQVNAFTRYIGGEVRLAYYFDGKKVTPVTGFAVSGNLFEACGTMVYSKETTTKPNYHGPKYVLIPGMGIA